MNHLTRTLALAAIVLAGAFGATCAQASAQSNFNVSFKIKNADPVNGMLRVTSPLPSGVSGLTEPAAAIAHGSSDPASGNATFSLALPLVNRTSSATLKYTKTDGVSSACTFTIAVSRDTNTQPYLLHFTTDSATRCPVPADVRTSNGQFTSTTYELDWSS